MTTLDTSPDTAAHVLQPVLSSVLEVAHDAPLLTLGRPDGGAQWYPGSWLADPSGAALGVLLQTSATRWGLGRHAAAALAFKGYAWAATLPVIVGWAAHRRVPMLHSDTIRIGLGDRLPYVRVDLGAVPVAVAPADTAMPLGQPAFSGADDDLLPQLRTSILNGHLHDVIEAMHRVTRVGTRVLWGSVAEAVAFSAFLAGTADPVATARLALEALGDPVADLVDLSAGPDGPSVQRRTCCLWFTGETGRGQYCSTCCVTH